MSSKFPFLICVTLFVVASASVALRADDVPVTLFDSELDPSAYAVIAPCGSTSEENTIANAIALQNARLIIMPFIVLFFISSTSLSLLSLLHIHRDILFRHTRFLLFFQI